MKNKTVIVTGGTSGIGESICKEYANLGWEVLILGRNSIAGEALKVELSKISSAIFYYCDLSIPDSIQKTAKEISRNHPSINSIIHNAKGPYTTNSIADNLNNEIDRDFNIFIRSPLILCELLYSNLVKSQDAAITFIGSTNSSFISHQPLSYHVCKGALMQAVRFLAASWGPRNIRVNLVNPGIVDVPGRSRKNINIFSKAIKAVIPLGRTALASEVATACIFLSSSNALYITGTTINLDGGEHLKDHFSLAYKIFESNER